MDENQQKVYTEFVKVKVEDTATPLSTYEGPVKDITDQIGADQSVPEAAFAHLLNRQLAVIGLKVGSTNAKVSAVLSRPNSEGGAQ